MKFSVFLFTLALVSLTGAQDFQLDLEKYRDASEKKWAADMEKFAERDAAESHPASSILFAGSSSIRLWETISDDMLPYHAIQRGFGGSKWSDVAVHWEKIIKPHQFKAVVFFVANDIKGNPDEDKTPEEVLALFQFVAGKVLEHNPKAQIFCIGTTPNEARWSGWPEVRRANELLRKYCRTTHRHHFIGTESLFIGPDGLPKTEELFIKDKLHLNPAGYEIWCGAIKSQLDSVLGGAPSQKKNVKKEN
ncbi:MAG: GDSL-type esterase/lipase family protein [Verrucomicrobiota bacterium]